MTALNTHQAKLLQGLLKYIDNSPPTQQKFNQIVKKDLSDVQGNSSLENRKSQWELLLKKAVFDLAATEGDALKDENTKYYTQLRNRLDLVLTFTEHDACEQNLPFTVLQDLLETQTIASCSHIFSWIEERSERLTEGLVPQKGKALILLRTLNDLLRRLSKMGSTTIFCGRILTFLSGVFPLGERSGVNLRGEYGPTWEGVQVPAKAEPEQDEVMVDAKDAVKEEDKMQVDEETKKPALEDKKDDFYNTFWSLQLPFSKPPLFAQPNTFDEFKDAVDKVIPVIREATIKERAMMGHRAGSSASLKRKREPEPEERSTVTEYFFAKFLTSPELLDLEIADTHFRRQFLFQLAILLSHLQTFTKAAKATWATTRNRSLQMDFTLEPAEAEWVQETYAKVIEEFKSTSPNGRAFTETVTSILEREKNWVKWKNELCTQFDKEPWSEEVDGHKAGLEEATRKVREKLREPTEDWPHTLGSESLTEIWGMGYRDLSDLQNPFRAGDVKDFVKKLKQEDGKIALRQKQLAKIAAAAEARAAAQAKAKAVADVPMEVIPPATVETPASTPAPVRPPASNPAGSPIHPSLPAKPGSPMVAEPATSVPAPAPTPTPAAAPATAPAPPAPPTDDHIIKLEEHKQRWSWLALRTARDHHLGHFGKIGTGDIEQLAKEIEAEKRLPKGSEELAVTEEVGSASPMTSAKVLVAGSDSTTAVPEGGKKDESVDKSEDGDVKMSDA